MRIDLTEGQDHDAYRIIGNDPATQRSADRGLPSGRAIGDNLDIALRLPVASLHLDLVSAPTQLEDVLAKAPTDLVLSLDVVDGRNIWRADLNAVLDRIEPVVKQRGAAKVMLAPSALSACFLRVGF